MLDIPPEVLASAFEIGVLSWGIRYLLPVCLVCKEWNQVVINTPHLWGIIEVNGDSRPEFLLDQISRAKAAPLTVFVSKAALSSKPLAPVLKGLVALSQNWVSASMPKAFLNRCRWADLRNSLRELSILNGDDAVSSWFFHGVSETTALPPPALRHLSVDYTWVDDHLLTSSIQTFSMIGCHNNQVTLSSTLDQLSKIPNVRHLCIQRLHHQPRLPDKTIVVRLDSLLSLEACSLEFPSFLLSFISCRSLNSLTIGPCPRRRFRTWPVENASFDPSFRVLSPFLTQWCNPKHLPSSLNALKLEQCMSNTDIPNLIRFLARLPNLTILALIDDALDYQPEYDGPGTDEDNILLALASPTGARSGGGGWLCPSLRVMHVEADILFQHLLDVVVLRGCQNSAVAEADLLSRGSGATPPRCLRTVIGLICPEGTKENREQLRNLVAESYCTCVGCCLEKCTGKRMF